MTGSKPDLRVDVQFVQVPLHLITDPTLHPLDKLVCAVLVSFDRGGYCAWPSNRTIAGMLGCSCRSVQYSLKRLEAVGWIVRVAGAKTYRGQVIRLNWRRPGKGLKGMKSGAGGGATGCTGGVKPGASNLRFEKPERKEPEVSVEGEILTAEELAYWQDQARSGNRVLRPWAATVLRKHAEAVTRAQGAAPGEPLAGEPGAARQEPVRDSDDSITKSARKSRHALETEHKSH